MRVFFASLLKALSMASILWAFSFPAGVMPEQMGAVIAFLIAMLLFTIFQCISYRVAKNFLLMDMKFDCLKWHVRVLPAVIAVNLILVFVGLFLTLWIYDSSLRYGREFTVFLCLLFAIGWFLLYKGTAFVASKLLREKFQTYCRLCNKASERLTLTK